VIEILVAFFETTQYVARKAGNLLGVYGIPAEISSVCEKRMGLVTTQTVKIII
jgi:hypothetical protein